MKIKHLSITVRNPERVAKILAELTAGKAERFLSKTMTEAWICIWNREEKELIEFLPDKYLLQPSETGAVYQPVETSQGYNSTHVLLEIERPLREIIAIADRYNCHHYFRPKFGGPLYEVWIEDRFLVEFVSDEINRLKNSHT